MAKKPTAPIHRPVKSLEDTRHQAKDSLKALTPDNIKRMNNFEIASFNFSIKEAVRKNVPRAWEDVRFRRIYLNKIRSLIANIKRDPELVNKQALEIVSMEPHKMAPELWEEAIKSAQRKRDMMVIAAPKNNDGLYQCMCRSRNTTFYQMQTRGADEPMTVYITCHDCDSHWKE